MERPISHLKWERKALYRKTRTHAHLPQWHETAQVKDYNMTEEHVPIPA